MADGPEISSWIGQDFITALSLDCRHAPPAYLLAQQGHSYKPLFRSSLSGRLLHLLDVGADDDQRAPRSQYAGAVSEKRIGTVPLI
jgi:hypothetical protein